MDFKLKLLSCHLEINTLKNHCPYTLSLRDVPAPQGDKAGKAGARPLVLKITCSAESAGEFLKNTQMPGFPVIGLGCR